jgi:hypothetical protein
MSLQDEAESFLCDTMRMRFPGREGTFFGAFWVGEPVRFPGRWDVDQGPLEGTVWQVTERWVILEAGESLYVVCARPFLDRAPELGATRLIGGADSMACPCAADCVFRPLVR